MKSAIRVFAVFVLMGSAFGCAGSKTVEVVPVDGSDAKPSDTAKGSDEIVAPKAETPPAPVETPPAPKAPEEPKAPSGDGTKPGDPTGPTSEPPALPPPAKAPDPIFIGLAPGVIVPGDSFLPFVTGVDVLNGISDTPSDVETPEAAGSSPSSEGEARVFRCRDNEVVTGFEYAHEDIDTGCGEDWKSGCAPDIHMAALKITCSPLAIDGASNAASSSAEVWLSGQKVAGDTSAAINSDASQTNCAAGTGIGRGIVGRVDGELRSFGLVCGHFHAWREGVAILPTFNKTATCEIGGDYEYGCSPGFEGTPFEATCGVNQAIVGLNIKFSGTRVLGIRSLRCADVKAVRGKPIFATEK